MPLFGLDISHHQDERLDLARCKREGISFVILKATEGSTFRDSEFTANLAEARAASLLVAAYHYQRAGVSARAQVDNIKRVVPRDVPVIPDVEANSGTVGLTREIIRQLRAAGYHVPLLYLPRWYWQQIGSPSLAGLPPLWSSRYPDNVVGSLADEWDDVPAHYWDGYGGLPVRLLQFTSSVRIAGFHPIDANAFRGTSAELTALFNGKEDDMELTKQNLQDIADAVWGKPLSLWAAGEKAKDKMPAGQQLNQARGYSDRAFDRLGRVVTILRSIDGDSTTVDVKALADELAPLLNTGQAKALADELHKRLEA